MLATLWTHMREEKRIRYRTVPTDHVAVEICLPIRLLVSLPATLTASKWRERHMPNRKLEKRFEDIDLDDLGPAPTDDDSAYQSELCARGVKPEDPGPPGRSRVHQVVE